MTSLCAPEAAPMPETSMDIDQSAAADDREYFILKDNLVINYDSPASHHSVSLYLPPQVPGWCLVRGFGS